MTANLRLRSKFLVATASMALVAAMMVTPAFAADALCPASVSVKQASVAPAPDYSVTYSATPNELEMITFYSGHPKDEASLVYDQFIDTKDASVATWRFPKDAHGYWVKCSYRGTTLELSKALPATLSSCRVTYDRASSSAAGLPAIRRIACQ